MKLTTVKIKNLYKSPGDYETVHVLCWLQNKRQSSSHLSFLEVNDGSCFSSLQVVCKNDSTVGYEQINQLELGSCLQITGVIKLTPNNQQPFELVAKQIVVLAKSLQYPLQKKQTSLDHLRTIPHVRHRTKYFRALHLVRNQLSRGVFYFFDKLDFMWVHAPIFTSNDTEGAGESFYITTVDDKNFFPTPVQLSVSGQLYAEAYALGFRHVYTFGPTFRAEKSSTSRHSAEFWMLEPEMQFFTLDENMNLIEKLLKHLIAFVLENANDELHYLWMKNECNDLGKNLSKLIHAPFSKVSYDDAVVILKDAVNSGVVFEDNDIHNKMDLKTEHERYLCEKHFRGPVFVYNYPKENKAFYMKLNDDQRTTASCDLLVPGVGELVGGSEREYRIDVLKKRCQQLGISADSLSWYLDLRKWGYYRSSGFGLGFDRLLMYITGVKNIRDTIPFPRAYKEDSI